mgnify:FL=1
MMLILASPLSDSAATVRSSFVTSLSTRAASYSKEANAELMCIAPGLAVVSVDCGFSSREIFFIKDVILNSSVSLYFLNQFFNI